MHVREPSVKNITLSANRFREGIDGRSKQITEWVTKAMDRVVNSMVDASTSEDIRDSAIPMPSEKETKTSLQTLVKVLKFILFWN